MRQKESLIDWGVWLLYAGIFALGLHPIRRILFADLYDSMSSKQEILVFLILVFGLVYFVIRPFALFVRRTRSDKK